MLHTTFSPLWNKYRPAILRMMLDAATQPQQYKLSAHEFQALNQKQKGGFSFTLQVFKGKAVNNIRQSLVAQELLSVLQLSPKASELTETSEYEIMLDRQFVLHVNRIEQKVEVSE